MLQFELASTFWAKTFPSGVGGLVIDVGLLDASGDACCWSFDYSFDRGIWANIAHAYFYKIKCALTQKCSSVDLAGVTASSVKVYLNGTKIKVENFKQYCEMYLEEGSFRVYEK